jgi:hypothetical protein
VRALSILSAGDSLVFFDASSMSEISLARYSTVRMVDCRDILVEVGEGGTFLKVHAKSEDPAIVHWGFDYLLKKLSDRRGQTPHFIVAHGAQWSRDSKRDFKVVAGKLVALLDGDPDEEEEGLG